MYMSADQMSSVILTFFRGFCYVSVCFVTTARSRPPALLLVNGRWPRGPRMPGVDTPVMGRLSLHSAALSHDQGKSPQT